MKQSYIAIVLFVILSSFSVSAKPKNILFDPPTITANNNAICEGSSAILTATGTGVTWHLTNTGTDTPIGTGSTLTVNPTATTIYYAKANNEISAGFTVTVYTRPNVSIANLPTDICSGSAVAFDSTVTSGTAPYTYSWTFSDGGTSTSPDPSHTFNSLGCGTETFTANLTVTDAHGCTGFQTRSVVIKRKPHVALEDQDVFYPFSNCENNPSAANPNFTLTVNNISQNNPCVTSYSINWGDGTTLTNLQPSDFPLTHTYTRLGAFPLTLTASAQNGCNNSQTYTVANQSNPAGSLGTLGATTGLCAPAVVPFTIGNWELNSPGTQYVLDYGDGTTETFDHPLLSSTINHTYSTTSCPQSSFTAILTVINSCDSTPYSAGNIQVRIKPDAAFTAPDSGCAGTSICFNNTTIVGSSGANCSALTVYQWNFGDPTSSTNIVNVNGTDTPNACHTFSTPGTYTVTLTTTNPCGSDTFTKTICIESALTAAAFTLNNTAGCGSVTAQATNTTVTTGMCNVTYNWSVTYSASNCGSSPGSNYNYFTNSTTATSANPSFNFPNPGTYTVRLTATNSCGSQSATQNVVVSAPPVVSINNIPSVCGGSSATITPVATATNCGTGTPTYVWSFVNGTPSTYTGQTPPAISYSAAGTYDVIVDVTNSCGTTRATQTFTVTQAVTADAGQDKTLCGTGNVMLAGSGSGGSGANLSYSWTPTTGLTGANTATPTANPSVTTTYTLTVRAGTGSTACTATDEVTVYRNTLTAGVIGSNQAVCVGSDPVAFTETTAAVGAGTLTYQWESNTTGPTATYTDVLGATSATYDPPVLTQNTWYRRKVISTLNTIACTETSNAVAVTLNSVTPGSVLGTQTICSGGDPAAFTLDTIANGTGTISYQWQSSTDGTAYSNISSATGATYDAPALSQDMWYRRITTSTLNGVPCSDYSNVLTITLTTPPTITQEPLTTQTLCAGATAQALTVVAGSSATYTYQWYSNTTNSTIGGTAIASATQNTFTPLTTNVGTIYYYCIVSGTAPGCNDTSATAQVTVIAAPVINAQPQPQTLCDGQTPALLSVSYQNGTGTPSYQWYSNTTNSTTGGTLLSGATTNTYQPSAAVGTVYYYVVITFPSGGCSVLSSNTAMIVINALPVVATPQTATICSGDLFTVTPANSGGNTVPTGTQYTWTVPANSDITGASNQTTPQTNISQTLTNITNAPVTVTYTVTPVVNGCSGSAFTAAVTVNPKPAVVNQTATICTGDAFNVPLTNGSGNIIPTGTTYSWGTPVMTDANMGGLAGIDATAIGGTLVNTTNTVQTATFTITPKWTSGSDTCTGNSFTVTVTVNPKPVISTITETSCSGTAFSILPQNSTGNIVPAGTTYSWAAPAPQSGVSGLAGGSNNSNISGTITNTNTSPATITYTVTPVSNGCTGATFTVDVTVDPTPTVDPITSETLCNGDNTPAISFTGTVSSTIFNWVNTDASIGLPTSGTGNIASFRATNTGTSPVTATITVTPEINGCFGTTQSFTITVNPAPSVSFSQSDQTICSGSASTAVTLSSATPGTTISWTVTAPAGVTGVATGGNTTTIPAQTLVNSTSAPITISYIASATTTGTATCPGGTTTYTITVTPVPYANTTQQVSTCSGTALNFIPADGGTNNMPVGVTFTWSAPTGSGFTGGSAQNIPQTSLNQTLVNTTNAPVIATYNVTPHYNGCDGVAFSTEVTINPIATLPNAALASCSGAAFSFDPTTVATILPAGTTYSWAAPTGTISGGAAGTGQTLITGTLTNTTTVVQTVVYTITPVSPLGSCNGTPFTLTVSVNTEFAVTSIISNYNGFQISSAGANDAFINLTPAGGTGTYTYSWTGPNGFTASTQNITNIGPGTYTVNINDGLCQVITQTFTIIEPMPLVIAEVVASHVNVDCFGQSTGVIEVEVTQQSIAPYDYAILLQDGTVIEDVIDLPGTSYVFDNLPAQTYNIRVTDANGTIKFINGIQVTQPATGLAISNSVISNFNGFSISCNGAQNGSIDLTISGGYPGYTFNWTGPNGFTATTEDLANLNPGVYTVTILDTTNACPVTQSFTITEPQPVVFTGATSAFNGYEISCSGGNNGSITITPTGGTGVYTYTWTGPNGFTATTQNLTNLNIGTYQLTMTDNNGCSAPVQSFTLTEPTALGITETHTNILCFGFATGAIDVTVTGGVQNPGSSYTYAWSGPNGYTATTEDLVNIVAGAYNLTATDANGCVITLSVTLTQQPEIIITAATTPITCYGANNASISLTISGGNGPYITQWSNLATGVFQDNLAAGNYVITVTDASNCIKQITVPIPEAPVFMVTPVVNQITCHGANNGSIALNLVGGIAPVTLVWSDGSNQGTTRNNLGPGTYTATIIDGTPCQIVRTFTIVEPASMGISANLTHALDCNDALSGAINLTVGGGSPPYAYNWSNGTTTEDLTAITSGTYAVTVTDSRGCNVSGSYTITRPAPIVLNVTSDVVFNCDSHYVRQTNVARASGGVPPFLYTWSSGTVSGAFGQNMNTNQNGTVIVTATDASGCSATSTFEVDTKQLGEANFTANSYAFTTYQQYSIKDPVQFDNLTTGDYLEVGWDFGDGGSSQDESPSHTYLREGIYVVKLHVVYAYGCTDTYNMTLVVTKGYDVMVPNAFTPNADGHNDTFNAVHRGLKSIELNVYDTWGALIYSEKGEVITGWNGNIKGNPSENGNFYYRIKAETFYGQIIDFEGPLVLVK
jgi:large repetitive protein